MFLLSLRHPKKRKKGRYARQRVASATAHVSSYGNMSKTFEEVAKRATENRMMRAPVTAKCMQNRYRYLQIKFDISDKRDQLRSFVGGEVVEMIELLIVYRKALDGVENSIKAEKRTAKEIEVERRGQKKKEVGRNPQSVATTWSGPDTEGVSARANAANLQMADLAKRSE